MGSLCELPDNGPSRDAPPPGHQFEVGGMRQSQHGGPLLASSSRASFGSAPQSYAVPTAKHNQLTPACAATLEEIVNSVQEGDQPRLPRLDQQIYMVGEIRATYQGGFAGGLPEGQGIAHFRDGSFYAGSFSQGDADGHGIYIFCNGSCYEGGFSRSVFQGFGSLSYSSNRVRFVGSFLNGVPSGHGQQLYSDGSYYIGEFRNGVKEGSGTYRWAHGQKYQGQFKSGLMHGKGSIIKGDLVVFEGTFQSGKKNSEGLYLVEQGSYYGRFINDRLEGKGSFAWNDGRIYEGNFKHSKMEGQGKVYIPAKNEVIEGTWKQNLNVSITKIYKDLQMGKTIQDLRQRHARKKSKHAQNSFRQQPQILVVPPMLLI